MSRNCSIPLPPAVVNSMSRLLDFGMCSLCSSAPHSLHTLSEDLRLLHAAAVAWGRLRHTGSTVRAAVLRFTET